MSRKIIYLSSIVLALGVLSTANAQTGQILIEWWTGITGTKLRDLWDNANFPATPAGSAMLTSFEVPASGAKPPELAALEDNYGARVRGYFHPPVTGEYTFWLVSDDEGRLYLSTEGGSAQKAEIARVLANATVNQWTKYLGQKSVPIMLEAGKKYYIEAVYKEGTGGDQLQVAYGPPGAQTVIPGSQLSPWDPGIAQNPTPGDGGVVEQDFAALGWTPGPGAVQHDVYLGTSLADVTAGTAGTAKGRQGNAFYYAGNLTPGTTYYWRIDEVEANNTIHPGEVWSFTVVPSKATGPSPADGARWVATGVVLSWKPGFKAIFHHVYFGTNQTEVADGTGNTSKGQQAGTTYTPAALAQDTTYYWRIDEFDGTSTHKGDVWRFRTEPVINIYDPNLVGWWKLDNEGTGTVIDYSGYGHHGTFRGEPIWVPGYDGDSLEFNGRDDWVNIDGYKGVLGSNPFSITAWIRCQGNGLILNWGSTGGGQRVELRVATNNLRCEHGSGNIEANTNINDNQWHHVALTVIRGATISHPDVIIWLDGQDDTAVTTDPDTFNLTSNFDVKMAQRYNIDNSRMYPGALDDVRLYDRVLTQAEIQSIMLRPDPRSAWGPSPANEATVDIEHVTPLRWSPGDFVAKHDVYFGTDELAATDADDSDTSGIYRGRQDANSFIPAETLDYGQTYYWRIDEYNTDATISTGKVWSFTVANGLIVEDMEAYDDFCNRIFYGWRDGYGYSADPACGVQAYTGNGSGSTVGGTQPPFAERTIFHGGSQSMPMVYDNTGAAGKARYSETQREWASPQDWTRHGVKALTVWFRGNLPTASTFSEGPAGTYTMTARSANIYDSADHFNYVFKQLSGVGTMEVKVESVNNTAADAKCGVMVRETLDPSSANAFVFFRPDGGVRFNRRYAAGEATSGFNPGTTLTLPHWLRLERYLGGSVRAWHSSDGVTWEELDTQVTVNMANDVYIGLALASNNTGAVCTAVFSDVITTGSITGQWQAQDIGITSNIAEQLYVAVEDSAGKNKVVNHVDPNAVLLDTWQQWDIDMKEFSNAGVNLKSVKKMYIGVGKRTNPTAGGTGTLYIDDIWLYRPRCVPSLIKPEADFNNDCVVDYADLQTLADNWLRIIWDTAGGPDGSGSLVFGPAGDYVAIENLFYNSTGLAAVSVSSWIRTNSGANQYIVAFDRNEYYRLAINSNTPVTVGQVGWHVMTDAGQLDYSSVRRVDDDQWHHIVGVFDRGTATIYIDGTAEPSATLGTTYGSGNMRYGFLCANSEAPAFDSPTPVAYPIQHLDDVRVYDYALSATDIARLANRTGQPATGPILWYKLDETSGSIAADSSGNGHNGQLRFSWFDMNMHDDSTINFKDYALVVDQWLDELLWP
jgi:hypothetical protein